ERCIFVYKFDTIKFCFCFCLENYPLLPTRSVVAILEHKVSCDMTRRIYSRLFCCRKKTT
ncbi:unnamed protein product, partial [Callosobruchus maculatus]